MQLIRALYIRLNCFDLPIFDFLTAIAIFFPLDTKIVDTLLVLPKLLDDPVFPSFDVFFLDV
jgi:hypothetical protein